MFDIYIICRVLSAKKKRDLLMTEQQLQDLFENMLNFIRDEHGICLLVDLKIDYQGKYPKARDYARTTGDTICVSPKILRASSDQVRGLLYHELGHVLLMRQGDYDHPEWLADHIAELCFQVPIYYDDIGVQTIAGGTRPRPSHLPKY